MTVDIRLNYGLLSNVGYMFVDCLSSEISVRLGFSAKRYKLKEHDRWTWQCLTGTMEQPYTDLLHMFCHVRIINNWDPLHCRVCLYGAVAMFFLIFLHGQPKKLASKNIIHWVTLDECVMQSQGNIVMVQFNVIFNNGKHTSRCPILNTFYQSWIIK